MSIDINNINSNTPRSGKLSSNVKLVNTNSAKNSPDTTSSGTVQDSVSLTDMSQRLKAMEQQIARLPIIDTQKVEQVKNAINNGTYEFNSERIAEKMIQFERDIL